MEGALVRVVDTISYISRDVLDAQNLGYVKFSDILGAKSIPITVKRQA